MKNISIKDYITLSKAKTIIKSLAAEQSILLLSAPGVGKSETVYQAAKEVGLECRSLLGTQIAPEDVSGIPRIVGERAVFCPPRVLLPEDPKPFVLFLDELPATAPDIQKAFYSLLLERRIGEFKLPEGTWVVAAGNRIEDKAFVRSVSSALINRVIILNIKVSVKEWLIWARDNGIRNDIMAFIGFMPEALMRNVPDKPVPFSTPRSWALLSKAIDKAESENILDKETLRALAFGRVGAEDAAIYCSMVDDLSKKIEPLEEYIKQPEKLPRDISLRWFILSRIRKIVNETPKKSPTPFAIRVWFNIKKASVQIKNDEENFKFSFKEIKNFISTQPKNIFSVFLKSLKQEEKFALIIDSVDKWGNLGADDAMLETLKEFTGLD